MQTETMKVHEVLSKIQTHLKAPKNLYNKFGKYKYRNFEGICEAVKPLLDANKATLVVSDHMTNIGDRYYVVAKATLTSLEDYSSISAEAWARESLEKKGMDESQITGTASSYARKYCLNGLFLLDDTKDADTDEYHIETKEKSEQAEVKEAADDPNGKISTKTLDELLKKCNEDGVTEAEICAYQNIGSFSDMTKTQAVTLAKSWSRVVDNIKNNEGIPFE